MKNMNAPNVTTPSNAGIFPFRFRDIVGRPTLPPGVERIEVFTEGAFTYPVPSHPKFELVRFVEAEGAILAPVPSQKRDIR